VFIPNLKVVSGDRAELPSTREAVR
jgi:hypothetical protein